jgi:glycogen(starch) synthase
MRILMTADTVGGVWTYTRELVAGLLEAGCDLTLTTFGRMPSPEQQAWIDGTEYRWSGTFRALTTDFKLEWMQENTAFYQRSSDFLLDCARQFTPDLIHSSQFCYGALPIDVPKVVVAHSDVLSWWRNARETQPDNSTWLANYRHLVSRGLQGADAVVAPTRWMLEQVEAGYGHLPKSAVIPNGRDLTVLYPGTKNLQAVTAGRLWDEGKNVGILTQVTSPVPLLVAGDNDFDGIRAATTADNSIRQFGCLSERELLHVFAESAVYVVTSRYEPFGLAAVEAALAGCAIIANDLPPLREVWDDAALYFRRNDARSLSDVLNRIAEDPILLDDYASRAQVRARISFSRQAMTSAYLDLYRQLVSRESLVDVA